MKKQCFYLALLAISAFFAFLSACGEGAYKNLEDTPEWGDIELELGKIADPNGGLIIGCGMGYGVPDSLCAKIEQGSSSSVPITQPSSSSDGGGNTTYTPTCTGLAETWIAGTTITKPSVKCNGTDVPSPVFSQAPIWDNPVEGVYNVSVTLDCGGSQQIGCGTLVVEPAPTASELSCLVSVSTGVAGTPIPKPTVKCGSTEVTSPTFTTTLNWENPVAGSYTVTANPPSTGDCKQAAAKSCGTGITVSPPSSSSAAVSSSSAAVSSSSTGGSSSSTGGSSSSQGNTQQSSSSQGNGSSNPVLQVSSDNANEDKSTISIPDGECFDGEFNWTNSGWTGQKISVQCEADPNFLHSETVGASRQGCVKVTYNGTSSVKCGNYNVQTDKVQIVASSSVQKYSFKNICVERYYGTTTANNGVAAGKVKCKLPIN